jgi:hypothetical protein
LAWFCLSWSSSNDNAFSGNVHAATWLALPF